jgi:hypothetical protein
MDKRASGRARALERARRKCESELLSLEGVEGVALGESDGAPVISVLVSRVSPALRAHVPAEVDGIPVRLERSGHFVAQPRKR